MIDDNCSQLVELANPPSSLSSTFERTGLANHVLAAAKPVVPSKVDFHNNCTVYVSNIPVQTTEKEFADAFKQYGEIKGYFLNGPRPEKLFGFGFVCFHDPFSPKKAITNVTIIHGQVLVVKYRRVEDMKGIKHKQGRRRSPGRFPQRLPANRPCRFPPNQANQANQLNQWSHLNQWNQWNQEEKGCIGFANAEKCEKLTKETERWNQENGAATLAESFNDLSSCYPSCTLQTLPPSDLLYGSNGHLLLGSVKASKLSEPSEVSEVSEPNQQESAKKESEVTEMVVNSAVVRVDCIPHFWDAKKLFNYVSKLDFPIVAALVYNDIDDRHFRQGLLQAASLQDAGDLLQMGCLKTSIVNFELRPSAVKSVGNMRSSYIGRFTVYSLRRPKNKQNLSRRIDQESLNRPSIPSIEPAEPLAMPAPRAMEPASPAPLQAPLAPYAAQTPHAQSPHAQSPHAQSPSHEFGEREAFHPLDEQLAFTPSPQALTPLFDLDTPMTESSDNFEFHKPECASPTVFSPPPPANWHQSNAFHPVQPASSFQRRAPQFGHKMSQTIVVDNFERKYVSNAAQLAAWMSRYGEVLTADIVSTSPKLIRAYISFDTPASAGIALGQLSMCVSGSHALRVRMA